MAKKYYCWIPILTHTLNPASRDHIEDNFRIKISDTDTNQEVVVSDLKWTSNVGYLSSFSIGIPEECFIKVDCNIQRTGLVSFTFDTDITIPNSYMEDNIAVNIFNLVRDIYHDHVHHDKADDATLSPVEANDDKEAIEKILAQYSEKITNHHKAVRSTFKFHLWRRIISLRRRMIAYESALGEFIYAQSLIDLHQSVIDNHDNIKESFKKAYDSISILKEKSSWTLMWTITVGIVILTIISLAPAVTSLGKNLLRFLYCPCWRELFQSFSFFISNLFLFSLL